MEPRLAVKTCLTTSRVKNPPPEHYPSTMFILDKRSVLDSCRTLYIYLLLFRPISARTEVSFSGQKQSKSTAIQVMRTSRGHLPTLHEAIADCFTNINKVLGYSTTAHNAPVEEFFTRLVVKHVFQELQDQGVTSLPFTTDNKANDVDTAKRISFDFLSVYGETLWPDRNRDPDTDARLLQAMARFTYLVFKLNVASTDITAEMDFFVAEFQANPHADATARRLEDLISNWESSSEISVDWSTTTSEFEYELAEYQKTQCDRE